MKRKGGCCGSRKGGNAIVVPALLAMGALGWRRSMRMKKKRSKKRGKTRKRR
jgi:hypothetical protein